MIYNETTLNHVSSYQWFSGDSLGREQKHMWCSVMFYEATQDVPENAIIVLIAPHALLQAISRYWKACPILVGGMWKCKIVDVE